MPSVAGAEVMAGAGLIARPRAFLRRTLPMRWVEAYRVGRRVMQGLPAWPPSNIYEQLYQIHALASSDSDAVGRGSWDTIGRAELALLRLEGLQPHQTLIDFGCGTGRLAVHAVPALRGGHYIGIDISREMLRRLDERLKTLGDGSCTVSLVHQPGDTFALPDASADMLCAFSVFTHMEHEDAFRYLRGARRVIKPGGRLVFSCLPMDNPLAHGVFLESASIDVQSRWATARSVTTSREMMTEIAALAGWTMANWYNGHEANVPVEEGTPPVAFGQSIGVLR
jgi:ubiquinone/menaquinone biosynthesis C-methylase UbiE